MCILKIRDRSILFEFIDKRCCTFVYQRASRYEGDLVAKCYYAKRKLVWEVLDSGLKSKIEIQWSDISAMKAICPDNLPGSLEIEVRLFVAVLIRIMRL